MNDAYEEGLGTFSKELPVDVNPYKGQVEKEKMWDDGWEDAKIDTTLKQRSICADKLEPIE